MRSAHLFCLFVQVIAAAAYASAQGFSPEEAVKRMKVPEGFKVDLVASEPGIAQPVCIEFDDRGRLWVIQYLQYPNPAGLQRAKVDRYSRTKYDKIPEPPPRGPKGADRITILEDFDAQARARKAKDFVSGLNLASGMAFGHGGVFVLQVPYLLFYPDKNGDDIPDSDPEVLLTGFGMDDAHSVANSLTWGPDGWLYGCQGSTVTANIRGIEFQQGVWRYHPLTRRFELFCEGGGNSWGFDFDEDGNIIYSTNFGGYRALHAVQGAYYWKQFGKHGALHNPYAYGFIDHMPHDNFVGGHVTVSGLIYQSEAFPEKYRNQYLHVDTLGHGLLWSRIARNGSSFKTSHGGELLAGNDSWFAPCDATVGPDGALYFSDWYDKRTAHPDPDADWDRSNGRVYRLCYPAAQGTVLDQKELTMLAKASSDQLVSQLASKNNWLIRKSLRLLADRRDVTVYPTLRAQIFGATDEHLALKSFWALYVSGGADEAFLNDCLDHSSALIRKWAVRSLGDQTEISPTTAEHLLKISGSEKDIMVRSQMLCTAKRLTASIGLQVASKVIRDGDEKDPQLPLLLWWTVERHCLAETSLCTELFASASAWQTRLIRETILPRLMRRYAADGSDRILSVAAHLLESAQSNEGKGQLLEALEQGLREQTNTTPITTFENLPQPLQTQLIAVWNPETKDTTMIRLMAHLGSKPARDQALVLAHDKSSPVPLRTAMVQLLGALGEPALSNHFLSLIGTGEADALQSAALDAIQQLPNANVRPIFAGYAKMSAGLRQKARELFFSRKTWAEAFLRGVDGGVYTKEEVALEQLQKIAAFEDKMLDELVRKQWGNIGRGTPEEKLADIRRFNNDLRAAAGNPGRGRELFVKNCAVCHELFGEGEKVGPELTHANRQDKDFLLSSIVDPSSVIRKEFLNFNVEMNDGRSLSGLIAEQSGNSVTLVAAKNERTILPREKIVSIKESTLSLMPEGLLHPLTPQDRRDLFSYLQSEKPQASKK